MTHCSTSNLKLSNSQFNKLKLWIRSFTQITLNLSLNVVDNSNEETNIWHNHYWLIHKFRGFAKPLQIIHDLI